MPLFKSSVKVFYICSEKKNSLSEESGRLENWEGGEIGKEQLLYLYMWLFRWLSVTSHIWVLPFQIANNILLFGAVTAIVKMTTMKSHLWWERNRKTEKLCSEALHVIWTESVSSN